MILFAVVQSVQERPPWAGHRSRKPTHGYKAHVATDQDAGLIRGVEVTTANVRDAAKPGTILTDAPEDVFGGSAFSGRPAERVVTARGGRPRTVWTSISVWPAYGRIWGSGLEAPARL